MPVQVYSTRGFGANGVKCLIYGRPGYGKTRLCATAPCPIIISCESGLLSLRGQDVPFIPVTNYSDLLEAYNWTSGSAEARYYQTPCLDSISDILETILTEERKKTRDPRKAYGELYVNGIDLIRKFRDLPGRNVVLVAKEAWDKDEATGTMYFQPSFPGKALAPQVPYYPDEVFRMVQFTDPTTKAVATYVQTQADSQSIAKDRSGSLLPLEYPDLAYIFQKIEAGSYGGQR